MAATVGDSLVSAVERALSAAGVDGDVTAMDVDMRYNAVPIVSAQGGSSVVDTIVTGQTTTLTIKVALRSITYGQGRAPVARDFLERPTGRAVDLEGDAI